MTVLIVGGYGIFGGRLVQLLQDEPQLRIIVAGRSLARATAYCRTLTDARAVLVPAIFDRDGDLQQQLATLRPDVVVDASGPFQAYGDRPYRLVQACMIDGKFWFDVEIGHPMAGLIVRYRGWLEPVRPCDQ